MPIDDLEPYFCPRGFSHWPSEEVHTPNTVCLQCGQPIEFIIVDERERGWRAR